VEASPDTPLGEIRKVLGVVAPPSAIIVPEVVERVTRGPYGEDRPVSCGCAHVGVSLGWHIRKPEQQKTAVSIKSGG